MHIGYLNPAQDDTLTRRKRGRGIGNIAVALWMVPGSTVKCRSNRRPRGSGRALASSTMRATVPSVHNSKPHCYITLSR